MWNYVWHYLLCALNNLSTYLEKCVFYTEYNYKLISFIFLQRHARPSMAINLILITTDMHSSLIPSQLLWWFDYIIKQLNGQSTLKCSESTLITVPKCEWLKWKQELSFQNLAGLPTNNGKQEHSRRSEAKQHKNKWPNILAFCNFFLTLEYVHEWMNVCRCETYE